jgi:valyl-tRNA synthetase
MTTEPETIFADMALAVHPRDKRYKKLVGKKALIPIVNKAIPIITDAQVNMNFAHGVKRITPAHQREDFAIAKEHGLETDFSIIDQNGKMKKEASMFVGQDAKTEARGNIVELLRSKGNLIRTEVSHHMEDYCNETGCRVEPIMSREWFVNTNVLKGRAIA